MPPSEENNMMTDLVDEAKEDLTLAKKAGDEPVILYYPKEETTSMEECEYCGYSPCGCGG